MYSYDTSEYEIITYQSGTICISGKGANLYVEQWKFPDNYMKELNIHNRQQRERHRFAVALLNMLNDINCNDSPKPVMCSMFAGNMEVFDTCIVFTDCLLGEIKTSNMSISHDLLQPETIPTEVLNDLKNGFDRTIEHWKRSF